MAKILIAEDDKDLCDSIRGWLEFQNYTVESVNDGTEAQIRAETYSYDAIILDWDLPHMSGLDLCRKLRASGSNVPILMLTGKTTITDKEQGLDAGADDYLTKPFSMREMSARVRAILRRASGATDNILRVRDIVLNPDSFWVTVSGRQVRLLRIEFALLEFFMRNPNKVFSARALLDSVWKTDAEVTLDAVTTCIGRLRKKLESDGAAPVIRTIHGVGYKLETELT